MLKFTRKTLWINLCVFVRIWIEWLVPRRKHYKRLEDSVLEASSVSFQNTFDIQISKLLKLQLCVCLYSYEQLLGFQQCIRRHWQWLGKGPKKHLWFAISNLSQLNWHQLLSRVAYALILLVAVSHHCRWPWSWRSLIISSLWANPELGVERLRRAGLTWGSLGQFGQMHFTIGQIHSTIKQICFSIWQIHFTIWQRHFTITGEYILQFDKFILEFYN